MGLARIQDRSRRISFGALGIIAFMLGLGALDVLTRGAVSLPAIVPPFGASAVIVFYTPESPFGRPWNVIVGHMVCAFAACVVLWLLPQAPVGIAAGLAVAAAGAGMIATRSFHPPGGATALLAVLAQPKLGFAMVLCPMLLGSLWLSGTRKLLDFCLELTIAPVPEAEQSLSIHSES